MLYPQNGDRIVTTDHVILCIDVNAVGIHGAESRRPRGDDAEPCLFSGQVRLIGRVVCMCAFV